MRLDNFDLIINLVALGMGVSIVPIRALAPYNQRRKSIGWPSPRVSPGNWQSWSGSTASFLNTSSISFQMYCFGIAHAKFEFGL